MAGKNDERNGDKLQSEYLATRLDYGDDMDILQQGSVQYYKNYFEQMEHSNSDPNHILDSSQKKNNDSKEAYLVKKGAISINSITTLVKITVLLIIFTILWDFLAHN